jgi:radical SAM/Cys-rich protein
VTLDPHPLTKESMAYLPEFFAEQKVEVISSLPYYQEFFTDKQRGDGVFRKSIESLHRLNAVGFGRPGTGLDLQLVYNPVGAFLPAPQESLEKDYKRELKQKFDVDFTHLYAITNMPIHRFKAQLVRAHGYEEYMEKLMGAFNPAAARGAMCRTLVSVSHDGRIFDCDFNQMLGMDVREQGARTVHEFDEAAVLARSIRTADHCFGCTAGAGSSCGGTTA